MAIVAADWTVDRQTGNIRYIGDDHGGASPSYATVIEFHRWLQDLADDQEASGDDELDIIAVNPSQRSTDNIITLINSYNITNAESEHLYDGSIIQAGGDDIWDGIVNFGNATVQIQVLQNGAVLADDWWNFGGGGLNADATNGISHRFMIPVRTTGADIDGRRLIGTSRSFGNTYSEFRINGTSRGNNVLALSDTDDLNNETLEATVATWTTITNTEGYRLLDVDNDTVNEPYYSEWNRDIYSINQYYERMKWLTRDGSVSTLYGLNGELFRGITHQLDGTQSAGTFVEPESVSWTGGTGQLFAVDSTTAATKMWIQVLTGIAPTTGNVSGATGVFGVSSNTPRDIATPFVGASTGTAIIGAYGLGIETADLSAADLLFDLGNNPVNPPNNVTFTVGGVVATEDRVLTAPWDGVTLDGEGNPAIDFAQRTLNTTLNGAAETAVVVTVAIPSDTPSSGVIRVELDSGNYKYQTYTSFSGSTFTIPSTSYVADPATAPKNVFIGYIDKLATSTSEAFTVVYSADRDLVVLVRDGGGTPIKEYITSAVLGSAGGSVTAIRTSDL